MSYPTEEKVWTTDLVTASGHKLRGAEIVYKTYGEMNAAKDNVILLFTRFGAGHAMNEHLVGEGMAMDPTKYCIVTPNMLANGFSASPSNTPHPYQGPRFPPVTHRDNVAVQHRLLTEVLGIEKVQLAVGWSMGGQQAYQWATTHPEMIPKACVISGTAKTSPHNRVFLESLLGAVTADAEFRDGWYDAPPRKGLRAMGRVYAGWAYSQDWYREKLWESLGYASLDDWLIAYWDNLFEQRKANDLIAMANTWIAHDISAGPEFNGDLEAALASIEAEVLLMPCDHDLYFRVIDNELELKHLKKGSMTVIPSIWGHMCAAGQSPADTAFIDAELKRFLKG